MMLYSAPARAGAIGKLRVISRMRTIGQLRVVARPRVVGQPAAELFTLRPEPGIAGLLDETIDTLSRTIANLCVTLDPERVVLGGGMMGAAEHIMPRVAAALRRSVPFPPTLSKARFADDAPLLGAIALALESAPRTS